MFLANLFPVSHLFLPLYMYDHSGSSLTRENSAEHREETAQEREERMINDYTRYKLNHHFVYRKFYHSMLCACCDKYFGYGVQCKKCQLACHLRCHTQLYRDPGFLVPCLDTPEELKQSLLNPAIKHRFVPLFNTSANWCCHCGFFLSPGQGNGEGANRRCEKCGLTCHAQCQALIARQCSEELLIKPYEADED